MLYVLVGMNKVFPICKSFQAFQYWFTEPSLHDPAFRRVAVFNVRIQGKAKCGRIIFSSIDRNKVEVSSKVVTSELFLTSIGPSSFRDCAHQAKHLHETMYSNLIGLGRDAP